MTVPVTLPPPKARALLPRRRRLLIRGTVRIATLLVRLRPGPLRRVLERLSAGGVPATLDEATRVYREVILISPRCAGWQGCLPRSVSVAMLCRLTGTWPDWCAGVRASPPFAAHAWLEAEGRIVGEPGEPAHYRPLIRVQAGGRGAGR